MLTDTPYKAKSQLATWFERELLSHHTLSIILAGAISGLIVVILQISFATLVFSGELNIFLPRGIALMLFGAFISGVVITLTSSISGMISTPQDSLAAILALITPLIVREFPPGMSDEMKFNTIIAFIFISTLLTGLFHLILGLYRFGDLTRYIPYPVIGGILAGTGWLLIQGGFSVMTDIHLNLENLPQFFAGGTIILWLPGLIYAVAVIVTLRHINHHLILPLLTLIAVILFFAGLWINGISMDVAIGDGLLLGDLGKASTWQPLSFGQVGAIDWSLITRQAAGIGTIVLVSSISLLLNSAGIELSTEQDIDLNQELRAAGSANFISSFFGGFPGYQALSITVLANQMRAASRVTGLIAASLSLVILLVGGDLIRYFPKPILGGLLLYLGLTFLIEWLYDAYRKLPSADYTVVILILVFIMVIGFLEGVAAGVVVTIALFVAKYSRVNVVKYALSGARHRSNVDRPTHHRRILAQHGDKLHILKLHGYLFFGTAHNLLNIIRERLQAPPPIQYLVLDFRLVTGLDTSAIISFTKVSRIAESNGISLIYTNISPQIQQQLKQNGLLTANEEQLRIFADLDHGLEWCENQLIVDAGQSIEMKRETLQLQFGSTFTNPEYLEIILRYFDRQDVEAGKVLIQQGELANDLYFVESGQVTAQLEIEDQSPLRLRSMGAGTVVGEIGLYLGDPRTASVIAETPSTVYRLTSDSLRQLEQEHPDVASSFHRYMIHLLAERLSHTDEAMRMLLQ